MLSPKCWEILLKLFSMQWVWSILWGGTSTKSDQTPKVWTINFSASPCLSSHKRLRRWHWPPPLTEVTSFSSNPSLGIRQFPIFKCQWWVLPIPELISEKLCRPLFILNTRFSEFTFFLWAHIIASSALLLCKNILFFMFHYNRGCTWVKCPGGQKRASDPHGAGVRGIVSHMIWTLRPIPE